MNQIEISIRIIRNQAKAWGIASPDSVGVKMNKIYETFNFLSRPNIEGRNRFSILFDPNIQFALLMVIMRIVA